VPLSKYIVRKICPLGALTIVVMLAFATHTIAADFTIKSGETEMTPQVLNGGEKGVIEQGGSLVPPTDMIGIEVDNNDNTVENNGSIVAGGFNGLGISITSLSNNNKVYNNGSL
jgi:hypothetical protein